MLHPCKILLVAIFAACLISSCTSCNLSIGEPLDVSKFTGEWFLAAATPMNGSMSKCGRFLVKEIGHNAFRIRFKTVSTVKNIPIVFNVEGAANGKRVIGTWQLEGSETIMGPFRHVIMFPRYDSVLGMFICSYQDSSQKGYKIAMIWSRERNLPSPLLTDLKHKMESYINRRQMLLVDQKHC